MKSPKLVWAPFRNYLSTRYPVCDSFLGPNHGVLFRVFIKENKRRGMELDHYLTLYYRDYDEINSKSIHRAVQACHGLTVPYQFSGDYVAMCGRHSDPVEYSGDMTLADFRHILDYFSTSFDDTIRETHSGGSVLAVQINCALEQRLYARDVFTTVAVDRDFIGTTRVISPLSEALGKSVEICKLNCDELKREGGRMDISSDDLRNPYTDILLTNMDPTSENWGKFTESPSLCGNFILLSDNGADLSLKLAQKMAGYCLEVLKPLFEKALRGEISRQDVLAEIMSENMMKWKSLEDAQDNEQFGSRRGFVARIGSPTTWNLAT